VVGRGRFWVIEGMDGAGKSTQAARLVNALRAEGRTVLALREPGATPLGERIRSLLLGRSADETWEARAEALLFFAARVELLAREIAPALKAERDVVCERFSPSTMAYQGQNEQDAAFVLLLDRLCVPPMLQPDRILILDLPAEESYRRVLATARARGAAPDAIEARGLDFQRRVRAGYLRYAREQAQHCTVIEVQGLDEEAVAQRIRRALAPVSA
jgi:dTMP kinase